ncbi:hypothetical protein Tco_1026172 [Tanacetum coccineum]
MMMASKSCEKHPAHKALYEALIQSLFMDEDDMDKAAAADLSTQLKRKHDDQDEDPSAGPNQGKKTNRGRTKELESSKKSSTSKETSKGNTPPKASSTDKSVNAEETVAKPSEEVTIDVEEKNINNDVFNDADHHKMIMLQINIEQTWFNDLVSTEKDPLTFDELMATPIDFSMFAMNRLKLDKITKADLVGLVYKLLKGN